MSSLSLNGHKQKIEKEKARKEFVQLLQQNLFINSSQVILESSIPSSEKIWRKMLPVNSKPTSLCSCSENQEKIDEWIKYIAKPLINGNQFLVSVSDSTWIEVIADAEFNWLCYLRTQLQSFDLVITNYPLNFSPGFLEEENSYEAFIFDFQ